MVKKKRGQAGWYIGSVLLWLGCGAMIINMLGINPLKFANSNGNEIAGEIVVSETKALIASETDQTIPMTDINLQIPSCFNENELELKVDKLKYNTGDSDDLFNTGYNLTLKNQNGEEIHELPAFVEVNIPLEIGDINTSNQLDDLDVIYYDTDQATWRDVAWYYDVDKNQLALLTNHFTEFRLAKSTVKETNDLMQEAKPAPILYSQDVGLYAKGTSAEVLEELKEERATLMTAPENAETNQIVAEVKRFKGTFDGYEQVLKLVNVTSEFQEVGQVFTITNETGKTLGFFDLYSKNNYLNTFDAVVTEAKSSGIAQALDVNASLFGYAGYFNNAIIISDELGKGNYGKAGYELTKAIVFEFAPKLLGPGAALIEPWVFIGEKAYEEVQWYAEDNTKTAYQAYYNGRSYSLPDSHWHFRFDALMEEVAGCGESVNEAMYYLDNEMDTYLAKFWLKENQAIRQELGASESMTPDQKAAITAEYKQQRMIGLQQNIMARYVKRVKQRLMEYQILSYQAHYNSMINRVVEIDITADKKCYDLKKSGVNILVDNQIIWSDVFDNKETIAFKARLYKLLPAYANSESTITIETKLVDINGYEKTESIDAYLLDLGEKQTLNYTEEIAEIEVTKEPQKVNTPEINDNEGIEIPKIDIEKINILDQSNMIAFITSNDYVATETNEDEENKSELSDKVKQDFSTAPALLYECLATLGNISMTEGDQVEVIQDSEYRRRMHITGTKGDVNYRYDIFDMIKSEEIWDHKVYHLKYCEIDPATNDYLKIFSITLNNGYIERFQIGTRNGVYIQNRYIEEIGTEGFSDQPLMIGRIAQVDNISTKLDSFGVGRDWLDNGYAVNFEGNPFSNILIGFQFMDTQQYQILYQINNVTGFNPDEFSYESINICSDIDGTIDTGKPSNLGYFYGLKFSVMN